VQVVQSFSGPTSVAGNSLPQPFSPLHIAVGEGSSDESDFVKQLAHSKENRKSAPSSSAGKSLPQPFSPLHTAVGAEAADAQVVHIWSAPISQAGNSLPQSFSALHIATDGTGTSSQDSPLVS
jgi:hypothetical protein